MDEKNPISLLEIALLDVLLLDILKCYLVFWIIIPHHPEMDDLNHLLSHLKNKLEYIKYNT